MDLATDETVLGDFNDAELTHHGITSRMFRRDGKFFVNTEGPDGKLADFEVKYVFGVDPLQQYMVEFDRPADMPENEDRPPAGAAHLVGHAGQEVVSSRSARREGEARSDRRAALDRPGPALEQHVRRLPLDEPAEELRRGQRHVSHDVVRDRRELRGLPRAGQPARASWPRRSRCFGTASGATPWPSSKDSRAIVPQIQACAPCHSRRRVVAAGLHGGLQLLRLLSQRGADAVGLSRRRADSGRGV